MYFYFIGIKGSGMSALANLLKEEGHEVRGMDVSHFIFTERLLRANNIIIDNLDYRDFVNVDIFIIGHDFMHHELMKIIAGTEKKFYEYHHFLGEYALKKEAIAIAGTHGKTTTTGMMYQVLQKFENVSLLRGDGVGKSNIDTSHFVFEACEYQNHFLAYHVRSAIITNIDYDHVDFFSTKEEYNQAFNDFAANVGNLFIDYEDAHKISHSRMVTYGVDDRADYYAGDYLFNELGVTFSFFNRGIFLGRFHLPFFGMHNLKHSIAIGAFVHFNNYDLREAYAELAFFSGVKRRMEIKIISDDVFIDDYAHHPKEIEATLEAIRVMYPNRIVNVIFKPDRYSRLVAFLEEFKKALLLADRGYVVSCYEKGQGYQDSNILTIDTKVRFLEGNTFAESDFDETRNQVFVFMSSKNMNEYIEQIVKIRQVKR